MSVVFDFDGSLALARSLYDVAADLEGVSVGRRALAGSALADWRGVYADEFTGRMDHEQRSGAAVAVQLRAEADGWAEEWRKAMDQENWDRYAAAVNRAKWKKGLLDKIGDAFFGDDDLPKTPRPAARPSGPMFAPTRSFADYSKH